MTHPFDAYFAKHKHFPRVRIVSGVQVIRVEFAPGYVKVTSYPRGGEIYITRSAWLSLVTKVMPLTKMWLRPKYEAPDHDVAAAMTEAYDFERARLQELRQQKRHRGPKKYAGLRKT